MWLELLNNFEKRECDLWLTVRSYLVNGSQMTKILIHEDEMFEIRGEFWLTESNDFCRSRGKEFLSYEGLIPCCVFDPIPHGLSEDALRRLSRVIAV